MASPRGRLRVGTSGYHYDHWRGRFYPPELPQRAWFEHYARTFDTLEINNTFYRLPEGETFAEWGRRAPAGFLYAVKMSRFATHLKKLSDPGEPLRRFLDRARRLREHLGPILVQLPPRWQPDLPRLRAFLAAAGRRERWAVEVRDPRWLSVATYDALGEAGAALVIHDMLPRHPQVRTADFVYLRFHGQRYQGTYPHQALTAWARRIAGWLDEGTDVYTYFNNDDRAYAVYDALDLLRYVEHALAPV